jgi:transcriptional regulator with XRE-family HTH domain
MSTQKECFGSQFIGDRLKAERERLKLSQQQAADFAEVRREMWGKYERDRKSVV